MIDSTSCTDAYYVPHARSGFAQRKVLNDTATINCLMGHKGIIINQPRAEGAVLNSVNLLVNFS